MSFLLRISLVLSLSVSGLCAQAPNYQISQYTLKDGLPSNECHDILQDSIGYIWIATDRGLVKYDGYTFKTYGIKEGLEDISCLRMKQDINGDIWIMTLSRRIFIYRCKEDRFEIYKYQSTINQTDGFLGIGDFSIDKYFNLYIELPVYGFLVIDKNGSYRIDDGGIRNDKYFYFTRKYGGVLMLSYRDNIRTLDYESENDNIYKHDLGANFFKYKIFHNDIEIQNIPYEELNLYTNHSAFTLDDGSSLISLNGINYVVDDKKVIHLRQGLPFSDLYFYNGGYISTGLYNEGVKYFDSREAIMEDVSTTLLSSVSATRFLVDNKQTIWVTTLRNGIYSLRKNEVSQVALSNDISSTNVTDIEVGPQGLYFVTNKKSLHLLDNDDSKLLFNIDEIELTSIAHDSFNQRLIIGSDNSFYLDSLHNRFNIPWQQFGNQSNNNPHYASINKIGCFNKNEFLIVNSKNFSVYSNLDSIQTYSSKEGMPVVRIHSAAKVSKDSYLMGTLSGLQLLTNGNLTQLDTCPDLLQIRIDAISSYNETFIFGTQGNGLVFWDLKNKARSISESDGLLSDVVEDLFLDDKGKIYVITKSGLSVVSTYNQKVHIDNYTTLHGLPSDEVNGVAQYENKIYIATSGGIGLISGEKNQASAQQIMVEGVEVNDKCNVDLEKLNYDENNIKIKFKTMDYTMASKIPYRYKINEGAWNNTTSTYAIFSSLSSDRYKFEVQSQNIDGIWSDSQIVRFKIGLPWWRTFWFFSLISIFFVSGVIAIYRSRIRAINISNQAKQEINDLERSALQAQMNPHFVFNCLNSIQSFIMSNQKDLAMDYLSRFAILIRQNLHASTEAMLTLDVEISMLTNYLELEKMRFHDNFRYSITLDTIGAPQKLLIPPMVIQPYVENAILHGMKSKKGNGVIAIKFVQDKDDLHVKIIDNGGGIKASKNTKKKSLGMSITEKRLSHLTKQTGNTYKVNTTSSNEGTTIDITIRLRDNV